MKKLLIILLAVSCLVANNHTRRKYYIANYCTTVLSSLASIGVAVWAFIHVFDYRAKFVTVDYSNLKGIPDSILLNLGVDPKNVNGPYSTFWFDISILILSVLIIAAILNIANLVFKTYLMKEEKRLLQEGDLNA